MDNLAAILASRDARHQRQVELLREHPEETLLCLTVIMPGSEKRNALSLTVAHAAVEALRSAFSPSFLEERDLPTGYEAFLLTTLSPLEAKRRAVQLEEMHPLGRLFDVDVFARGYDGPISRTVINCAPRRCLLCEEEARLCMRRHTHSHEELMDRIRELVEAWEERNS